MKTLISIIASVIALGAFLFFSCRQVNQLQANPVSKTQHSQERSDIQEEMEEEFGSPSSAFYRGFNAGKGEIKKKSVARLWELFAQSSDPTLETTDDYIVGNNSCMPLGWQVDFTLTSESGKDTLVEFKLNDEKFALGFVNGKLVYFLFITQKNYEDILALIEQNGNDRQ